ncbi:DUF3515 domain-containing protein [Gordonia hankookensis]|uniref:DUF3515 domain-containing protein n=1 Tax=Gordonia hankookensis TaxID=589403 RepID=UPI001CBCB277
MDVTEESKPDGAPDQVEGTSADTVETRYGTGPRLSPALIATLVAVPVMVIIGFITFAALRPDDTTPIESYATGESAPADCAKLIAALPQTFDGFGDKQVDGTTVRWPADGDGDAVTLRCGISRPSELSPTSNLQVINPVQWFITDTVEGSGQAYVCVDHRPYVAMWIPANAGNGPITDVSAVIERTLPRGPLDFG